MIPTATQMIFEAQNMSAGDLEAGTHEGFALALLLLTGHGTEQGGTLEGLAELESAPASPRRAA